VAIETIYCGNPQEDNPCKRQDVCGINHSEKERVHMKQKDVQVVQSEGSVISKKIREATGLFVQTMEHAGIHVSILITLEITAQDELDSDPIFYRATTAHT
jgi:hypothetical protein